MKSYLNGAIALLMIMAFTNITLSQIDASIDNLTLGCITSIREIPGPDPKSVKIRKSCRLPRVSHVEDVITPGRCEHEQILKRYYKVVDACEQSAIVLQLIFYVIQEEKPTDLTVFVHLTCNPDLSQSIPKPKDFTPPGCYEDFEWEGDDKGKDGCYHWLIRKYVIYTHCNHKYIYTIHYTWTEDKKAPKITCPPNIDLGCNPAAIPAANVNDVVATDDCCDPTVTWIGDIIVSNPFDCHQIRIRQYMAEDCCGNQSICQQEITWQSDATPPTIEECPDGGGFLGHNPDYSDIDDLLPKAKPNKVKASDACGDVTVTVQLSTITVFNCEYSITRTYIVADECGNEAYCYEVFTWTEDHIPPVIEHCPPDIDLGCNPDYTIVDVQSPDYGIVASDNCGVAEIIKYRDTTLHQNGCTFYQETVYTVIDHSGNQTECTQKVFWTIDEEAPSIICPPDIYYCEPTPIPPVDLAAVQATDNCGIKSVQQTASSIQIIGGAVIITRTFTATDHCGNQSSCDQKIFFEQGIEDPNGAIYVYDTLPPVDPPEDFLPICLEDVNYGCVMEMPNIPDPDLNYVTSNCDGFVIDHLGDDMVATNFCEYVLTRSYRIQDCCGDEHLCFQSFRWRLVVDTTTVIPIPGDEVAFCQIPPVPDFTQTCGTYIPMYLGQTIQGDCRDGSCTVIRHWKASVCGGLSVLEDQIITVQCDLGFGNDVVAQPEKEHFKKLEVYPNPAQDVLYLTLSNESIGDIQIINLNGQVVKTITMSQHGQDRLPIDISTLTPGMYFIQSKGDTTSTQKFLKE